MMLMVSCIFLANLWAKISCMKEAGMRVCVCYWAKADGYHPQYYDAVAA